VTLRDDLIERYSRQILLPEVGGRGQERLLAARLVVTGNGPAAAYAAALLAAAGAGVTCMDGPADPLTIASGDVAGIVAQGCRVLTLVARPCMHCAAADGPSRPVEAAHGQAVGALAAAEAMRLELGLATEGRVHTLDLGRGVFTAHALPETDGCARCRGSFLPT
jgi:hypothetical protein